MTVRSRSLFSRNARSWRRRSVTSRALTISWAASPGPTRLAYRLEQPPDAVPRPEPELRGLGDPGVVYRARQRLRYHRNVVRVDVVERVALEQLPRRVPQHAFH